MTKGRMAATVAVAALFLVTGCSNGSDKSAGKVDASGKASITDATSTAASSADSSPSSSDDPGSTTSPSTSTGDSPTIGDGLPDGFPSDLAPPKGAKDVHGIKTTRNGRLTIGASYGVDDDVKGAYERVKAQVTSAGYQLRVDEVTSAGDNSIGTLQGTKGSSTISVLVGANVQGSGAKTMVTMTIDG